MSLLTRHLRYTVCTSINLLRGSLRRIMSLGLTPHAASLMHKMSALSFCKKRKVKGDVGYSWTKHSGTTMIMIACIEKLEECYKVCSMCQA